MVNLSLKIKVLLLLLLMTIVMIVGMALNMQYGFKQGFFNYRKSVVDQFNKSLVNTLESYYQENTNWDGLENNKRLWNELLNLSSVEPHRAQSSRPPKPRRRNNINENKGQGKGKVRKDKAPPSHNSEEFRGKGEKENSGPRRHEGGKFRPRLLPPIVLLNAEKQFLVGMQNWLEAELSYYELKSNTNVVGYMATEVNNHEFRRQDELFVKNIQSMLIKIGLIMVVLATFIALPVARYFTLLINKITYATQQIARGDYSTRIHSERKDELGILVNNVNSLAKSLESNAVSQKTMIADIAHELRTPISVIVGEIEAIQDGIHKADEQAMSLLHSQISSLKNLVNDLHELSESDRGSLKYKMEKVDIVALVEQNYHNYELKFKKKNISFTLHDSLSKCFIIGDINRLNQLFNNLLSNSAAYTDEAGKVEITLTMLTQELQITITDSSPGLTNEQLEMIFERWYRVEKSRNKYSGGSGLGLAICREIINAHEGKIVAKKSSMDGVEMIINLPIKV
jgi:two-component system sensor histidine kinase BaeS